VLVLAFGYYFSKRRIFSSALRGYLGVVIVWIVYGTTNSLFKLDVFELRVLVPYLFIAVVMFLYFNFYIHKLRISAVLALSTIIPIFILPVSFVKITRYLFIQMDEPITTDLAYWGLLFGSIIMGLIWGVALHKTENRDSG
jgi:hypothetical protein